MIPEWMANGDLPPGVPFALRREIRSRLGFNPWRLRLFEGFDRACRELRSAGCRLVYLDGSFVTRKERPGDFDACWDIQDVDDDVLNPVFWELSQGRAAQKAIYMGEFFPAQLPEGASGRAFVDFFQVNKSTGQPKGILASRLRGGKR